jgi:N-acetyltransferase 10
VSQILALFVKAIRKFARALEELRKQEIGAELRWRSGGVNAMSAEAAGGIDSAESREGVDQRLTKDASQVAREMETELEEEGDEAVRSVRERQRDLIDSLDLDQ